MDIMLIVALCAAVLTFVLSGQALSQQSFMRFPWVIAAAVAVLVFLSLRHLGEGWATAILIPYAALGLTLLLLLLLKPFLARMKKRGHRPEDDDTPRGHNDE